MHNVHFQCADALTANLENTALIFIDNQAWDANLVTDVWQKIHREAPVGVVVVEFGAADYFSGIVPSGDMEVQTYCYVGFGHL